MAVDCIIGFPYDEGTIKHPGVIEGAARGVLKKGLLGVFSLLISLMSRQVAGSIACAKDNGQTSRRHCTFLYSFSILLPVSVCC